MTPPSAPVRRMSDATKVATVLGVVLLAIVVPTWLALRSVESAAMRQTFDSNPTPYGYTISLLLYLVPGFALTVWFLRHHARGSYKRKAVGVTLLMLLAAQQVIDGP